MFKKIPHKLNKTIQLLLSPDDFIDIFIKSKKRMARIFCFVIVYIFMGYVFQHFWPFPHFWKFTVCFLLVCMAAIWYINYFSSKMKIITSSIINQPPATKANTIYYSYGKKSSCYILIPLLVVFVFGYGGCSIFGALQTTPTLIWMLSLFTITVYVSIIGYLKYIVLAIYLYKLSANESMYQNLSKSNIECIPIQLKWLQDLTKLYHTYRGAFFTIGSAYIIAYGAFCWLPEMKTNKSHPAFLFLWGIISLAVVFIFPIVTLLEYRWIKKIVEHLKRSYINDLVYESEHIHIKFESNSWDLVNQKVTTTMYAIQIMNSSNYPIHSLWNTGYSLCITVFNLSASIITVLQGMSIPPDVFRQIF